MTRGLVRTNNLSDLPDPIQARTNLGLATADYNRIRGLFASAGVSNVDVQRIAGSTSNFQQQINSISATVSGIDLSLYVDRTGDTITGEWTNIGRISAVSILQSGTTPSPSSDALFTHEYQEGNFRLTTSTVNFAQGLTVEQFVDRGSVVLGSGISPDTLIPISIGGISFFLEGG
jgi:hypothetical protein